MWKCNCPVHKVKIYTERVYIQLVLILGARSLLIFGFKPRPLYPQFPLNSKLYGLPICTLRARGESSLGIEAMLLCFTTCSLFNKPTVLTRPPLLALSWFIQRQRRCVVLHTVQCRTVLQNCFRMRKNWSYRAQAICSHTKAAGIHSCYCAIRFPVNYFWLAICDSSQCLQVNSNTIYRGHLFLFTYLLYLSLDAFTRLWKDSIRFVGSVYPSTLSSVRLEK
jgi:hypothetical protein